MEKFQPSMYDNCGEIENFSTYGEISDVSSLHMTGVEKSEILHIWHVCDVENIATSGKFMLYWL